MNVAVRTVRLRARTVDLEGDLTVPADAVPADAVAAEAVPADAVRAGAVPAGVRGIVVFAHGSGSGRASPRGRSVAAALHGAGFATLLFDLLTPEEQRSERERAITFDIGLLAERLGAAVGWVRAEYGGTPGGGDAPVGLFGASTGAAAALTVAARRPDAVGAVVSRGGRPDLAAGALGAVRAPTLLIVGGADPEVATLNERAQRELGCRNRLAIVPGAGHLFAEPGALDQVADLTVTWFNDHLTHP